LFAHTQKTGPKFSEYHLTDVPLLATSEEEEDTLTSLDLLYVENSKETAFYRLEEKREEKHEGLGRLPRRIPSVSSLLLFNSNMTPYKRYVGTNGLEGEEGGVAHTQEKIQKEITPAPDSVSKGESLVRETTVDIKYIPDLVDEPEFKFPQNLVLPNVAGDIFWSGEADTGIAPSQHLRLPNVNNLVPSNAPFTHDLPTSQASSPAVFTVKSVETMKNPLPVQYVIPPPHIFDIPVPPPHIVDIPVPPPHTVDIPVPPVGPPLPLPEIEQPSPQIPSLPPRHYEEPPTKPATDGERTNLFQQIREFPRQKQLRNNTPNNAQKELPKRPGDAMDALRDAIERRRRAMMAANDQSKSDKNTKGMDDDEIKPPPQEADDDSNDDVSDSDSDDDDDTKWD